MATKRGTKGNRSRPAQGAHTNDRYPKTQSAGGDNVNSSGAKRAPKVNNNSRRRAT